MPFTFSDDLTNAVRNYLNNQGSLSELLMLRSWFGNEFEPQMRARGLLPPVAQPQAPAPIDQALPAGVELAGVQVPLNRQQRRQMARKIESGEIKVNGAAPGASAPQETPKTHPPQ